MNKEECKKAVCAAIDARKDEIIAFGEDIFAHPELAYRETRTSQKVSDKLSEMGLEHEKGIAITGIKARMKGAQSRVTVGIMGELDAVICRDHPDADPETGAAHCCGHNAQIASMLGAAMGLADSGAMAFLGGDVALLAVPAEEGSDPGHLSKLMQEGKIKLAGGKQQFIVEGALDGVDMAMMVHTGPMSPAIMEGAVTGKEFKMGVGGGHIGSLRKRAKFIGKEAHPGIAPHEGINALNAANLALMAINANRETFRDEDMVRVHAFITKGGLPSVVPADIQVEIFIRSKRVEALVDAARKVDRSLKAGALAVGAEVEIETMAGYLPRITEPTLDEAFLKNSEALVGKGAVGIQRHVAGCTDMGDISHLMPAVHQRAGGVEGRIHEADYRIADKELAYVMPAKAMAMTVIDLLWDDAALAVEIKEKYKPVYTKETYIRAWQEILGSYSS
ncbi:MAG: amidohydrolase [Bacillota bacterium]